MKSENKQKFESLISDKKSGWLKKAQHRQKYKWFYNIIHSKISIKILCKFYALKRKLGLSKYN